MENIHVIILAAGVGARMTHALPKALIPVAGKPLVMHLLDTLETIPLSHPPTIVVGHEAEKIKSALGTQYNYVLQTERHGTAHAVACCREKLQGQSETVLTFFADTPLISRKTIIRLIEKQRQAKSVMTIATTRVPDFGDWREGLYDFGRIIRDSNGMIIQNIEKKHSTPEIAKVTEISPGFFCFDAEWLWNNIEKVPPTPPTNERYLPHIIDLGFNLHAEVADIEIDPEECLGVNTLSHLAQMETLLSTLVRGRVS